MIGKFYGEKREEILDRLVKKWLSGGRPVAILQGFPGCGKSQLAREVAEKAERTLAPIEPQLESTDIIQDLFLDLAIELEQKGSPRLAQEFDKGEKADFSKALLDTIRYDNVLIIIDEFQRLFPKNTATPPAPIKDLVEKLGNSPNPQGRLLLISNRFVKTERWCENCCIEEVKRLDDLDAEALFTELLESSGLSEHVPESRRREIAHRLGGNPRALKTLVACLRTDSLDNLLSAAPDLFEPGDVVLDPQLVEDFERELLERALPKMEEELLKFMRWLSVHRRPFRKEAFAQFTGGRETPESLRKQLFDRFLLEQGIGGDVPHPLVREISVTRLRAGQGEWVQAHNLAANYYFRYFKAQELKGETSLATSYVELRHHLYESGRIAELSVASERLTQFALSQITLTTPIPTSRELLETRIALLFTIPDDRRPKVLNYHIARCLLRRGTEGDDKRALKYAREATGTRIYQGVWVFRINLEYQLNGIFTTMQVIDDALRAVRVDEGVQDIYLRGAELMSKANRLDEAIKLLEKGIDVVPVDGYRHVLYQRAIQLAGVSRDPALIEKFALKGVSTYPKGNFGLFKIIETALTSLAALREAEAVKRLQVISESPQQTLADYLLMRIAGDWANAANIAHNGRMNFPKYAPLRINEADARLALGQVEEAVAIMKDYPTDDNVKQLRDNPVIWFKAYVAGFLAGNMEEAKKLAALYAPHGFDLDRELDNNELMRLWEIARDGSNTSIEVLYPGLSEFLSHRNVQSKGDVLPIVTPVEITLPPPRILVVATEWDSHHGGLSTFNRDFCASLTNAGAQVICYLPQAITDEIERATERGVKIVVADKMTGFKDATLLTQRPTLPDGFMPDVVIGHDRITGPASAVLVKEHFPQSKRVLLIHTSPEEIEWHKEERDDSTSAERAAERKREQLSLSEGCSLVIAVGPRLMKEFSTDLQGAGNSVPIVEMIPGLPEFSKDNVPTPPPAIRCLILGRVEDYQLKGLDLAAKALGRVISNWKDTDHPKLIVRGAPIGTDKALVKRLNEDSGPTELDIVIRHYVADETEIRRDLREASLVLMPSKKEGFGLVGVEAIACGVPILISSQSGLAETLRRYVPTLADEWILPVTGDVVTKWAERIELRLTGRDGAFSRALVLREELAKKLSWEHSAVNVLRNLFPAYTPRLETSNVQQPAADGQAAAP